MKKLITSTTITICSLALLSVGVFFYVGPDSVPTAHAKEDSNHCLLSSLKGSYGYSFTGFV